MKRSGMFEAWVDCESRSDRILKVCKKGFSSRDMKYAPKLFNERGVKTNWFTKFGFPGECKETIDETFALIDKAEPDHWFL